MNFMNSFFYTEYTGVLYCHMKCAAVSNQQPCKYGLQTAFELLVIT